MPEPDAADSAPALESLQSRKRKKHLEVLDDSLQTLDVLIYIELSVVYYLDCTTFLLLLRTLVQLFFLTQRPSSLPDLTPSRPHLSAIVGSNLLCFLLHILQDSPQAGQSTRGYLHGSILIDFVGELGPISKWRLISLDFLILGLQILVLAMNIEKLKIKNPNSTSSLRQDYDAEETGRRRSREDRRDTQVGEQDSIELQEFRAEPADEPLERTSTPAHPLDTFCTGETMLMEVDVIKTIRWQLAQQATSSAGTTSVMHTSLLADLVGVRFRFGGGT